MVSMKLFDDFLLYEEKNLRETASYCMVRNRLLLNKSLAEVELMFLEKIMEKMKGNDKTPEMFLGSQQTVYNAYCYVDRHDGTTMSVNNVTYGIGRFEVNFFVRLGREIINA
jgi:hypothetical protein